MPMMDAITRFFAGLGYVGLSVRDPGNLGNAPAPAPVQRGDYEYIQGHLVLPVDTFFVDVESIAPEYVDPRVHGVSVFPVSGLEGGGLGGEDVPTVDPVDPTSYDLAGYDYVPPEEAYNVEATPVKIERPVHRPVKKPVRNLLR